jgi:hypothetical protein
MIAGRFAKGGLQPLTALAGGLVGSCPGARRFSSSRLCRVLGVVLLVAAFPLIQTACLGGEE